MLKYGASLAVVGAVLAFAGSALAADPREAQIDAVFAQWNKPDSPGCNVFVFKDGKVAFQKAYGMADLEADRPITADSVFYIASMSKQFTGAAITLLSDEGKIDLKASVRKYIPELPPLYDQVSIEQMLHHTAGLRDYLGLGYLTGLEVQSNDRALALLKKQTDLNFTPGAKFDYSNSGFVLLSITVERVSGQSFSAFMHDRFFGPLGMTRTLVDQDHRRIVKGRAQSYSKDASGTWLHFPKTIDATGDGNVLTTVGDLQKWDENFYSGKVGGAAFLSEMSSGGVEAFKPGQLYARGIMLTKYRGQPIVRHGGAFDGFRTEMVRFPDQHVSTGLLCNAGDANPDFALKVADIYLADKLGPVEAAAKPPTDPSAVAAAVTLPADRLAAYVGRYRSPELDRDIEIRSSGGALYMDGLISDNSPMNPVAGDKFLVTMTIDGQANALSATVTSVTGKDGKVSGIRISAARMENIRFERIP
jgi:CubicO group peptidase (beta-lactamase class C family)